MMFFYSGLFLILAVVVVIVLVVITAVSGRDKRDQ